MALWHNRVHCNSGVLVLRSTLDLLVGYSHSGGQCTQVGRSDRGGSGIVLDSLERERRIKVPEPPLGYYYY